AEVGAAASVDELLAAGFALDSASAEVVYGGQDGTIAARLWQDPRRDYVVAVGFELREDARVIRLEELALRFDSTTWRSGRVTEVRLASDGIQIDSLDLRDGRTGRIFANGMIPQTGAGELDLSIRELPIGQIAALLQEDAGAQGLLSADLRMEGEAENPTLRGAVAVFDPGYRTVPFPTVRGTFEYANRSLTTELEGLRRHDSRDPGRRV